MTPQLRSEVARVLTDLSWLERCTCSQFPIESCFVRAGHTMPPAAMLAARRCPARRQEVIWAYGRDIRAGYFGGLSAGQRTTLSLEEALAFIEEDTRAAWQPSRRRRDG